MNTAIEADDTHPELRDRARDSMTQWHRLIGRIIKDGKTDGLLCDDIDPYALASFYAFQDKNYKAAMDEVETAIKLEPSYMPNHFRFGQVAAVSGTNFIRGEEELKKYLAYKPGPNEPDLASTHYYLGMIYEKQGKTAA